MKTKSTFKHILLALTILVGIASCKKDKKDNPPPTPPTIQAITITDLKALSTSASVTVPDNRKINGTVISDAGNKNIDSKTVVLQQSTGKPGVIVTFDAAQTFAAGDSLEIVVSKQILAQVNGETVLQNIPAANAKKVGTANISARSTNAAAIKQNAAAWDGTLVTIPANSLTGGSGNYTGTLTAADTTGSVSTDILAGAAFAGTTYPVSVSSFTGIVRVNGNNVSLDIRKAADVVTGAITRVIIEDFTNVMSNNPETLPTDLSQTSVDFNTAAGHWENAQDVPVALFPGSQYDGSFTTADRSYVYLGGTLNNQRQLTSAFTNLAGLKQVSVTFAGSTMTSPNSTTRIFPYNGHLFGIVAPFNAATDYFQIAIVPALGTSTAHNLLFPTSASSTAVQLATLKPAIKLSEQVTQTGQFVTVTYTVPTHDQLVAAGVSDQDATSWLQDLNIGIINLSTRAAGTSPLYVPILIDKVVFGF